MMWRSSSRVCRRWRAHSRYNRGVETADQQWQRYRRVLAAERLPAAVVDVDAFERNIDRMIEPLRAAGKRLRIATKSLRCPALVERVRERAGDLAIGLMTYTAGETAWWASHGATDLLLAYPTVRSADTDDLAIANRSATAATVVDDRDQVTAIAKAARRAGTIVPLVIELDVSWRPLGAMHVGVRRSPLRTPAAVVELAQLIAATEGTKLAGVMAYEAHIAGTTDAGPFHRWQHGARRAVKRMSRGPVERARAAVARALADAGLPIGLFNGGGTGSVAWAAADPTLTEVTIGSGFVDSLLFDQYRGLELEPAACFALQVVRRPAPLLVTCHGGGFIASGDGGPDRLPRPWLPEGCALLALEGAGEVQTPVALPEHGAIEITLGDPILFRHAKAGELAEHFDHYLLVRGDTIVERAPTWRGLQQCFLG